MLKDHSEDLSGLPTAEQKQMILHRWRSVIDDKAHDYADHVLSHPHRPEIEKLEVESIVRVF